MHLRLLLIFLLVSTAATAQLQLGGDAGANYAQFQPGSGATSLLSLIHPGGSGLTQFPSTRGPARIVQQPSVKPFDFAATKPYLAFFCRLELDIEEATKFPVRFRLGEVRTWQQELSKRD